MFWPRTTHGLMTGEKRRVSACRTWRNAVEKPLGLRLQGRTDAKVRIKGRVIRGQMEKSLQVQSTRLSESFTCSENMAQVFRRQDADVTGSNQQEAFSERLVTSASGFYREFPRAVHTGMIKATCLRRQSSSVASHPSPLNILHPHSSIMRAPAMRGRFSRKQENRFPLKVSTQFSC